MKLKEIYIRRSTREDGMPSKDGMYFTGDGRVGFFGGKWEADYKAEWWMELMSESKYLEGILPEEVVDETFIEHHISYQHHGVVRMAINKYKKWLLERLLDEDKDYKR